MNVNEWGVHFLFSTGFDMSGFVTLTLDFTKPDGTTLSVTNPDVELGGGDIETTQGLFVTDQYLLYIFKNGDVDQAGDWTCRATYDDAGQHLISDPAPFTIYP